MDSEVSKDLGTFADCANEATELATSSGMYYLTLTATEMTADIVAIIVKTSTAGAKTTSLVFYTAAQTLDELDDKVDSVVAKLPTNYIMGSSVLTAKDDEIDDIKTEVLTHPTLAEIEASAVLALEASLTAIKGSGFATGTDSLKVLSDILDLIKAKTDLLFTGIATEAKQDIIDAIVDAIKLKTDLIPASPASETTLTTVKKVLVNKWKLLSNQLIIYDDDGATPLYTFNLVDSGGNPAMENVYQRTPA